MKAWSNGKIVDIRSPNATRPWQHVLEPLSGYLCLAENLYFNSKNHGEAYNFGPSADQDFAVSKLINEMSKYWNQIREHLYEAGLLKLNCDKAMVDLGWKSTLEFDQTVKMTVDWYKEYYQDKQQSMYDFSISQIDFYTKAARQKKISWATND